MIQMKKKKEKEKKKKKKKREKDKKVRCEWDLKSHTGHLPSKSIKIKLKKEIFSNHALTIVKKKRKTLLFLR